MDRFQFDLTVRTAETRDFELRLAASWDGGIAPVFRFETWVRPLDFEMAPAVKEELCEIAVVGDGLLRGVRIAPDAIATVFTGPEQAMVWLDALWGGYVAEQKRCEKVAYDFAAMLHAAGQGEQVGANAPVSLPDFSAILNEAAAKLDEGKANGDAKSERRRRYLNSALSAEGVAHAG